LVGGKVQRQKKKKKIKKLHEKSSEKIETSCRGASKRFLGRIRLAPPEKKEVSGKTTAKRMPG